MQAIGSKVDMLEGGVQEHRFLVSDMSSMCAIRDRRSHRCTLHRSPTRQLTTYIGPKSRKNDLLDRNSGPSESK